jgi:hypothetical protein
MNMLTQTCQVVVLLALPAVGSNDLSLHWCIMMWQPQQLLTSGVCALCSSAGVNYIDESTTTIVPVFIFDLPSHGEPLSMVSIFLSYPAASSVTQTNKREWLLQWLVVLQPNAATAVFMDSWPPLNMHTRMNSSD